MISTSKNTIRKMIPRLEKGEFGTGFTVRKTKNGRGDYGFDELFLNSEGLELFKFSFDGARIDTRYYINEEILKKELANNKVCAKVSV